MHTARYIQQAGGHRSVCSAKMREVLGVFSRWITRCRGVQLRRHAVAAANLRSCCNFGPLYITAVSSVASFAVVIIVDRRPLAAAAAAARKTIGWRGVTEWFAGLCRAARGDRKPAWKVATRGHHAEFVRRVGCCILRSGYDCP